jgi:hypothetical protein
VRFYLQKFRGDILVTVSLLSVQNRVMRFRDPGPILADDDLPAEFTCHGDVVVATRVVSTEELATRQSAFVTDVLIELTWAFWQGWGDHPTAALRTYIEQNI